MKRIAGIDEAGRGPVIGPMVFAGVVFEEHKIEQLQELGVKDSKLLTKEKREELFTKIQELATDYCIVPLSPQRIDSAVLSQHSNLNHLGLKTTVQILHLLQAHKAVLDCPSVNTTGYEEKVRRELKPKHLEHMELIVENKADINHLIVGAASILAKVTRDRHIEALQRTCETPMGSGYPSDPHTKKFLEHNWDKYDFFRKSWQTWIQMANKKKQKKLGEF